MTGAVVSVEHLVKRYGDLTAVDDVSFTVAESEVLGLLGPNGAGKTTTIEILEGMRAPSGGSVRVLGRDPLRAGRVLRNRVGTVFQSSGIDATLTVREAVSLYASFYRPRRRADEVIAEVGLAESARYRIGTLSGGQQRRVELALALVGMPAVLFLDEPTTGLDPAARRRTWEVVTALRERRVAIVLTSHYLEEVQQLADRVVVLAHGRVVGEGPPDRLGGSGGASSVISFRLAAAAVLPEGPWEHEQLAHGVTRLTTDEPVQAMRLLSSWAIERGLELEALELRPPSLEEQYLKLTAT